MIRNDMSVAELREYLKDFLPGTKVEVVVNNYPMPFELLFGGSEGCTKWTADNMSFYVGGSNEESYTNQVIPEDELSII